MLGHLFDGLIHSDYYGAYRRFKKWAKSARFQFCLAHLVRDLKFLAEHPSEIAKAWGKGMLTLIRQMLKARQNGVSGKEVERLTAALTKKCAAKLAQSDAERVARRLRNHMDCFVRFMADPLAEATNNRAERGLRPTVLHRKCTQGTRSEAGDRTHERLQTLVATARQQGKSAYAFLVKAIEATMRGTDQPSMLRGW
jgi:transposase